MPNIRHSHREYCKPALRTLAKQDHCLAWSIFCRKWMELFIPNSSNLSLVFSKFDFILSWSFLAFCHSSPVQKMLCEISDTSYKLKVTVCVLDCSMKPFTCKQYLKLSRHTTRIIYRHINLFNTIRWSLHLAKGGIEIRTTGDCLSWLL